MTTFLAYGDASRDPILRHEIAEPVSDDIAFIDHDGRRIVIAGIFEAATLTRREDVIDEFRSFHDLGYEELVRDQGLPEELIWYELVYRALSDLGAKEIVVPPTLGIALSDHLRDKGIQVQVDAAAWSHRRRAKSPWEIEGIERAQRAADIAMSTAARMLREGEPTSGNRLRFEGEILTAELIREAMSGDLLAQGAESEEIIVQTADGWAAGHEPGSGPIRVDSTCIIDCFPRDRRTGAHTDMTRTFVPGRASADIARLHADCKTALELALENVAPGRSDLYPLIAEYFKDKGYPTQLHHEGTDPLGEGFFHALGHGVGLEVHEKPWIGRRSDALEVGDVIAIEPGLYLRGVGGVRLEDTVIVTDSGAAHLTDPYPYHLQP